MTEQLSLLQEPREESEVIKSIYDDIVFVRSPKPHVKGSTILAIDGQKDRYRNAQRVQEIIEDSINRFFELYKHDCVRLYTLPLRKAPALPTRRFLFEDEHDRCRVSLAHLINQEVSLPMHREADLFNDQEKKSYLQACTPKNTTQQFLLRFSSPWREDPQGQIRRTRRGRTYDILVEQEASDEYRRNYLEYLRGAIPKP